MADTIDTAQKFAAEVQLVVEGLGKALCTAPVSMNVRTAALTVLFCGWVKAKGWDLEQTLDSIRIAWQGVMGVEVEDDADDFKVVPVNVPSKGDLH